MKTMWWMAALAVATWYVGTGTAAGSDERPGAPARADGAHHDEDKVHATSDGKTHVKDESAAHTKGDHHPKININQASKGELMKLDGVSAGMAQKIIAYRDAHGPFRRAHDLEKVDGVGKDVLEKNAGRITVK